jgi:hypothetical protein
MTLPDWTDPAYLAAGTPRQRAALAVLDRLGLMRRLAAYQPVLTGAIPLAVDTPASDLDIICEVHDLPAFERRLRGAFGGRPGFRLHRGTADGLPVVVCGFDAGGQAIELFGQPRPVRDQHAYRRLVAEARLLALAGDPRYARG